MSERFGHRKLASILLLCALLGIFVFSPSGSVFAELDEPPLETEAEPLSGSPRPVEGGLTEGRSLAGQGEREVLMMDVLRRAVLLSVSWAFLLIGLILVGLTLRKTYIWLKAVQKARVPPTRYFNLQVQVRDRNGEFGLYNYDYYPVVVASSGSADLLLSDAAGARARFRIDYRAGRACLLSDSAVIVNGVPRREKLLKPDDRIIFGPYRLMFKDASIREQAPPIPGKPFFAWQFPIVVLLLVLSVLFRQAGAVPEDEVLLAKAVELQRIELKSTELQSARQPGPGTEPELRTASSAPARETAAAVKEPRVREMVQEMQQVAEEKARRGDELQPREPKAREPRSPAGVQPDSSAGPAVPATPDRRAAVSVAAAISPQSFPDRTPVPASEPRVEATAELPAPRAAAVPEFEREAPTADRLRATHPQVLQASVLGTIAPTAVRSNGINPLEGLSFARARPAPEIGRVKVRVIPPGRSIEYFDADILFIHAHPDDESIDFGSLMAMASRADKRIVTLLLTDGESGLDLYPERKVGDIYPARDLTGGALSQVRVVEATRALSILGSEMYIRWGLENRPYNTRADEVSPDEVIRGWGGEEQLVERLLQVLLGFKPTLVVSPDSHSGAYEHFEHEAVGQLVQKALRRLREDGHTFVKGHLVSIDPYQVDRYDGVTSVDALRHDGTSGMDYRAIQTLALKEHVTQRDAAVIGVNRLSRLDEEFYKALYWELDLSLEEYLR
jgi:LmbE family N-acetylglucosaminyl deacetylase